MRRSIRWGAQALALVVAATLCACGDSGGVTAQMAPAPTVGAMFGTPRPVATVAIPTPQATIAVPTALPTAEIAETAPSVAEQFGQIVVYDGALATGWTASNSYSMTVDLDSTAFVRTSPRAIAATSTGGTGGLCLTITPKGKLAYERSAVVGVSIWLSGGDLPLENDAVAIKMQGSNAQPYWVANDESVTTSGRVTGDWPLFSETRLYYLDIHRSVPPNEWVEAVVMLDDLLYDPEYTYLTGVCIKTDQTYEDTFYVDRVALLIDTTSN